MAHYDCNYCGGNRCDCMWVKLEKEFDIAREAMDEQTRLNIMEKVEPLIRESQEKSRRFITVFNIYKHVLKDGLRLDYEVMSFGELRVYGVLRNQKVILEYIRDNMHAT